MPCSDVLIIKVILLYDEFSNTGTIEKSISEIFDNDSWCYVMTIREFEILLYSHKFNPTKREEFIAQFLQNYKREQMQSVGSILEAISLYNKNFHFQRDMNYFSKLLKYLGLQLKDE